MTRARPTVRSGDGPGVTVGHWQPLKPQSLSHGDRDDVGPPAAAATARFRAKFRNSLQTHRASLNLPGAIFQYGYSRDRLSTSSTGESVTPRT
jgi:hypothetical protein